MRHFWTIYLTTLVVGTGSVYLLAPLARPFMAARFPAKSVTDTDFPVVTQRTTSFYREEEPLSANAGSDLRNVHAEAELLDSEPGQDQAPSPLSLGIRLVSRGDVTPSWGIVCSPAEYFMMDGLSAGVMEAGKLIDYRSTRFTAQGAMVEFMVDSPLGIPTTPYLTSQKQLLLFTGSHNWLSAQQVRELKAYYAPEIMSSGVGDRPEPPQPKGVHLVLCGDMTPGWGVVYQQANYYQSGGKRAGYVAAGSLIDYQRTVPSSKGSMIECLIRMTNGIVSALGLVNQKDLHLFTGSYKSLTDKQVKDVVMYYELAGNIARRRKEILTTSAQKNPFFLAYQSAYQALTAHIEKSRDAVSQRDHAVNAEKVLAQERLFELRMEETRLRSEYNEAETKFKDWKAEHADALHDPDDDEDVRLWALLKKTLAFGIPGLAY